MADHARPALAAEDPAALLRLRRAVDEVLVVDLDALHDDDVRDHLCGVQAAIDRLTAFRCRAAGALEARAVRKAGTGRESRAVQDTRRWLSDELRMSPSQAKQTSQTGRRLEGLPPVRRAFEDGELSQDHARVITDTLQHLVGSARDEAASTLVDAARDQDPVTLGRTARRLLAEQDEHEAVHAEQRRHARRFARVTQTPDGLVAIAAQLAGIDGEAAMTAIHAFRTPDAAGDTPRTPEQSTADALAAALRASLDLGAAPTQHGEKPHINVTVDDRTLREGTGVAELDWTGPVPFADIDWLVDDSQVCRIVRDAVRVPVEVSERVRTVPVGLWRALTARDRGCRWPGCPAPPAWCDVAHTDVPWRLDGRLTIATSALFCRRHHRRIDRDGWTVTIDGTDVRVHPPGDGPRVRDGPSP